VQRGFAGALVLMLIVLGLFAIARFIGRDRSKRKARGPKPATSNSAQAAKQPLKGGSNA